MEEGRSTKAGGGAVLHTDPAEEATALEVAAGDEVGVLAVGEAGVEVHAVVGGVQRGGRAEVEYCAGKGLELVGEIAERGLVTDLVIIAAGNLRQDITTGDLEAVAGGAVDDLGVRFGDEGVGGVAVGAGKVGEAERGGGLHRVERVEAGLPLDGKMLLERDSVDGAAVVGEGDDDEIVCEGHCFGEADSWMIDCGQGRGGRCAGLAGDRRGGGGRLGRGLRDGQWSRWLRAIAGAEVEARHRGDEEQHADCRVLFVHGGRGQEILVHTGREREGTGSSPPGCQGPHLASRRRVRTRPARKPCSRSASRA